MSVDCDLCPKLCENSNTVNMPGDGPIDADIMIIGEAPGATEDEQGIPFVGMAGNYLRDILLSDAGIPESKVWFTNAVRCRPPKNRTPTVQELIRCRPYLEAEIREVRPKVIVTMGNAPLATLLSFFYRRSQEDGTVKSTEARIGGITQWQGKKIWSREFNCWICPTFHPSFCMRNERMGSRFSSDLVVDDLHEAWTLTKRERPKVKYPDTMFVSDSVRAHTILDHFVKSKLFAFDIETGGNDRELIGFSLAMSADKGYYFSWDLIARDRLLYYKFYSLVTSPKYYKIMHNGAYEIRVLRKMGIPIYTRYFDTMMSVHLTDENFSKRLKDNAWIYTLFGGYDNSLEEYKAEHKIKDDYSKIPPEILSEYGALDAVATYIIYEKTNTLMTEENLSPLFNKVIMPFRRVLCDAEHEGMRVDVDRAKNLESVCEDALDLLESKIFAEAGEKFNLNSTPKLGAILYGKMGFKPLKKTKTGFSVDAESIEYVSSQKGGDIAKYLVDRSYIKTMMGTHVRQAIAFAGADGKVHTNYNSTGTVTGRISAAMPSLQNVPADSLIRSLYTASEGCKLIEADLKSAEIATVAAVSGEETFIRAFRDGLDIHSETYRTIYDLPPDYECTHLERRHAKTINFGLIYGLTDMGLARRLGITPEEAKEFMSLYFEKLPRVAAWMEKQKRFVRKNGYVVSVFGRRRRLPMGLSDSFFDVARAERQAMNSPIQSGAADYAYIGLTRLWRAIKKNKLRGRIVHTVHDCGLSDTPIDEVPRMVELYREAFETPVSAMPINMQVEIEVNDSWGEKNESKLYDILNSLNLKLK